MKHILIPTDFSDTSIKAADFALDLYGVKNTRYTLLNSYLKPAYRNALVPLARDMERVSLNGLRRVERHCRKRMGKVYIAKVATFQELSRAITGLDRDKPLDMVVMGTQGEGNYGRVGRNTSAVVTGAAPAVIAVPAGWEPAPVERILLADDGLGMGTAAWRPLLDIARRTGAHVDVVHVQGHAETFKYSDAKALAKARLTDVPHTFSSVAGNKVVETINRLAAERNVQLVAAVRRERSFLERIFQGSTSKRMALHSTVPLLVLRERD